MNAESALISKAVQTQQIETLIAKGVDEKHFHNEECKNVWRSCVAHIGRYRSSPSFEAVRTSNPDFGFEVVTDALDYVFEQFVRQNKRRAAINGLRDIAKAVDDPNRVFEIETEVLQLGSSLAEMFTMGNAERFSDMYRRIAEYDQRAANGTIKGVPIGVPDFDDVTFGIRRHEFISIVGWQGTGKSTLAQHIAFSGAYLAGFTTLIVSLEMEAGEMFERLDTMATQFHSQALQKLELGGKDKEKWERWAERAEKLTNDIIIVDNVSNCTPEKVHSLGQQYKPDLMIVDYVSLMNAPRSYGATWEKVTYLTQALKQIARDPDGPPIISVAQTNIDSADGGAKLENIAYSRSIGQDSDIVLGLHQDDKMEARHEMEVRMLKNRRGPKCNAKMYWNPAQMEFRPWKTSDMFAASDVDGPPTPEQKAA